MIIAIQNFRNIKDIFPFIQTQQFSIESKQKSLKQKSLKQKSLKQKSLKEKLVKNFAICNQLISAKLVVIIGFNNIFWYKSLIK